MGIIPDRVDLASMFLVISFSTWLADDKSGQMRWETDAARNERKKRAREIGGGSDSLTLLFAFPPKFNAIARESFFKFFHYKLTL